VYHTNRAAAYLERVWELQAAAAAAANAAPSSSGSNRTKKLITELEPVNATNTSADDSNSSSSSSSHDTDTGSSSSSSSWVELGGSLDGMVLDGSPGSLAKQLEAAVLDCRAALQLVPRHAKAHYRWDAWLHACSTFRAG
jgi:cobalamin biosynthesis Mg chelatase CobN